METKEFEEWDAVWKEAYSKLNFDKNYSDGFQIGLENDKYPIKLIEKPTSKSDHNNNIFMRGVQAGQNEMDSIIKFESSKNKMYERQSMPIRISVNIEK